MSRLTHGKEENIVKDKISKTPFPNWDRRLEILDNRHNVITKVGSRDEKGKDNNKQSTTKDGVKNSQAIKKMTHPRGK